MRAVNLLPRDVDTRGDRGRLVPVVVAACGLLVLVVLLGAVYRSASGAVDARRSELASTEAAINRLPAPQRPQASNGLVAQERADRVAALSGAMATRVPFDRLLRDLAYVLPEDAWLTGLAASAPVQTDATGVPPAGSAPTATTGTRGVTIEGSTFSQQSVSRVLARLAALPTLADVRLVTSAQAADEPADAAAQSGKKSKARKRTVVTFTIDANLRSGSGS